MADSTEEKSLEPTPRRRQRAREQGHIALSHDVASAVAWCGVALFLAWSGGVLVEFLGRLVAGSLDAKAWTTLDSAGVVALWRTIAGELGRTVLPVLGLATLLGAGASLLQSQFLFLPSRVIPDLSRINPLAGMGRIFSAQSVAAVFFAFAKVALIAGMVAWFVRWRWDAVCSLATLELPAAARLAGTLVAESCLAMGAAMAILAAIDYAVRRWRYERDLRMTPQELREEQRELEGPPQVQAWVRERMRAHRGPRPSLPPAAAPGNSPEDA